MADQDDILKVLDDVLIDVKFGELSDLYDEIIRVNNPSELVDLLNILIEHEGITTTFRALNPREPAKVASHRSTLRMEEIIIELARDCDEATAKKLEARISGDLAKIRAVLQKIRKEEYIAKGYIKPDDTGDINNTDDTDDLFGGKSDKPVNQTHLIEDDIDEETPKKQGFWAKHKEKKQAVKEKKQAVKDKQKAIDKLSDTISQIFKNNNPEELENLFLVLSQHENIFTNLKLLKDSPEPLEPLKVAKLESTKFIEETIIDLAPRCDAKEEAKLRDITNTAMRKAQLRIKSHREHELKVLEARAAIVTPVNADKLLDDLTDSQEDTDDKNKKPIITPVIDNDETETEIDDEEEPAKTGKGKPAPKTKPKARPKTKPDAEFDEHEDAKEKKINPKQQISDTIKGIMQRGDVAEINDMKKILMQSFNKLQKAEYQLVTGAANSYVQSLTGQTPKTPKAAAIKNTATFDSTQTIEAIVNEVIAKGNQKEINGLGVFMISANDNAVLTIDRANFAKATGQDQGKA